MLNGWTYRKKITIQGQSGAGTDYQVLLKVGESSGASGYDFHVEGHSANFPSDKNQSGDLRFTKSDGTTELNFWVEKVEGTSPNRVAYCWVKITDNLDNNVDIYCYYGNSSANNVSNGDDTFLLFDDFNGSNLDTNKWNELNSGPLSFSNSIMSIKSDTENTSHDIYSKDTFSYGHCLRGRVAIKQKTCFAFENSNHTEGVLEWYDVNDNWNFGVRTGGSLNFDSLGNADIGAWHVDEIIYKSGEGKLRRDGVDEATKTSGVPTVALPANSRSWSSTNEIQVDWIAVRKYTDPEPSFSSIENEERLESYDLDILLQGIVSFNYSIDICITKQGWLPYNFRRQITIDNTSNSNNLTDYQVKITLNSSNFNFDHAKDDGSDIAFADSDGTSPLDFWREKWDKTNQQAVLWVKVPSIPGSSTKTIYLYYGNSNADDLSNGDNTFVFFADFEECNINDNSTCEGFTESSGNWKVESGNGGKILHEDTDGDDLTSKELFTDNYWVHAELKTDRTDDHWGPGLRIAGMNCGVLQWRHREYNGDEQILRNLGDPFDPTPYSVTWGTEFRRLDIGVLSNKIELYFENDLKYTYTSIDTSGTKTLELLSSSGASSYFDNIWVRKYTDPEPSSMVGNEQTVNEIDYSIDAVFAGLKYSIDLLLQRLQSFDYNIDILLQKIKFFNYNVDTLIKKIINQYYNVDVLLKSLKSTYILDILIKKLKYINYNLDILLQKFSSINYNIDLIIEEITEKSYSANVLLRALKQESYVSDVLLQKFSSINYNIDLILNKIGQSQHSIDLILQTEEEKSEYDSDVLLKGILNLNYQSDVLLKLLKLIDYDIDVPLEKLQSFVYNINTILNKLESITYDNDVLLKQLQSFSYDIDILLKQLSSSIYDVDVLLKQLQVLTYNIDVIIKIIEKQISIDVILSGINESKYSIDVSLFQRLRFAPCKLTLDYNKHNLSLDYNKYNLNLDFQCNEFNLDFACQEE